MVFLNIPTSDILTNRIGHPGLERFYLQPNMTGSIQ